MKVFQFYFLLVFLFSCHQDANSSHPKQPNKEVISSKTEKGGLADTKDSIISIPIVKPEARTIEEKVSVPVEENINSKVEEKQIPEAEIETDIEIIEEKRIDSIIPEETEIEDSVIPETPIASVVLAQDKFHEHTLWDQLLSAHVDDQGNVNYTAFKKDEENLDTYLLQLKQNPISEHWSRNEKMAYWINAYNASTIKLILKNYPVSSIMKINGGKAWDLKWIELGEKKYSLNQIENDILRPEYKDARIHFAVNCAAKSCPPLWNRAFTNTNLEKSLESLTKKFINNPAFNSLKSNEVIVSKIFEWYADDFGNLLDYLNRYAAQKIKKNTKISYSAYEWALNSK
jgi:hypothetical protein